MRPKHIIFTALVFLILACTGPFVYAQTPIPTSGGIIVEAGTNNEKINLGINTESSDDDETIIRYYSNRSGMSLENFKIFDIDPLIKMYKNAISPLTPKIIQDNTNRNTSGYQISGSGRICTTDELTGEPTEIILDKYYTEKNTDLKDIFESTTSLAPFWTLYKLSPSADQKYHLERPDLMVGDPPPCNTPDATGDLQADQAVPLRQSWFVNAFEWLLGILNGKTPQELLVSKQLTPYSEVISNLQYGSKEDVSYLTNVITNADTEIPNIQDSGGITRTFFPSSIDETKGKDNADYTNILISGDPIKTRSTNMKATETAGNGVMCMLLPKTLQDSYIRSDPNDILETCMYPVAQQASCESEYFQQFDFTSIRPSMGADPGYVIPYRNSSCAPNDATRAIAIQLASSGFSGGSVAEENLTTYWDEVIDTSIEYGWNPMFVLTLWIEESAAGGHANAGYHLGCLWGWKNDGNAQQMATLDHADAGKPGSICDQMACLFSHPVKGADDFGGFMCSYNTTAQENGQCPSAADWEFANTIKMVYSRLVNTVQDSLTGGNCGFTRL